LVGCSVGVVRSRTQATEFSFLGILGLHILHHWILFCMVISKTLAITSPTSGGRSVGIVRSQTRPWSLVFFLGKSYDVDSLMI
jgi:hypothetical protein